MIEVCIVISDKGYTPMIRKNGLVVWSGSVVGSYDQASLIAYKQAVVK